MGLLLKKTIGNLVKRVGLGVLDVVNPNIKQNIESELGGKGKVDFLRLAIAISVIILVLGVLFGLINVETLKAILKAIK